MPIQHTDPSKMRYCGMSMPHPEEGTEEWMWHIEYCEAQRVLWLIENYEEEVWHWIKFVMRHNEHQR